MARKRKEISLKPEEIVEKLAKIGANNTEIADILGVDQKTVKNNYSEFLRKGRAELKIKLRRKMIQVAEKGNVVMLIFLAKNFLKMTDEEQNELRVVVRVVSEKKLDTVEKG